MTYVATIVEIVVVLVVAAPILIIPGTCVGAALQVLARHARCGSRCLFVVATVLVTVVVLGILAS
jgi:hypothetical protein